MRTTLLTLALLALTAAVAADDDKKPALAAVRVSGELGTVNEATIDGKTTSAAPLTAAGDLKIEVTSTASLSAVFFKASKAKLALVKEQFAATQKLLDDEGLKGKVRDKALEKLKAEYKAKERAVVVAEGALRVADKKLRLAGTARLTDFKKLDKDLPPGGAVVEGEAQAGSFAYGKDKEAKLAIKNGDWPILIVGPAAEEARKGKVRAYGQLKQGDKGALVLEATKVEEVK